jgi:hypothetical protein
VVISLLSLWGYPVWRDWRRERDCVRRYAAARTAADTILIDQRIFASARRLKGIQILQALTCREARGAGSVPEPRPVANPPQLTR